MRPLAQTATAKPAVRANDRRKLQERRICLDDGRGPRTKDHLHQEDLRSSGIWIKDLFTVPAENVDLRQRILGHLFCIYGI